LGASENEMSQDCVIEANSNNTYPAQTMSMLFVAILVCHVAVDALAALLPSTLGLLEVRLSMTPKQSAWLLGMGSLFSGLAQPICAIVSDRLSTRQLAVFGMLLSALGIGSLGLAGGLVSLTLIYAVGMIGVGMFHPVGAATIGELRQHARTSAVSIFFVSGMVGGVAGAFLWPRLLATAAGFQWLPVTWVIGLLLVVFLQRNLSRLAPVHLAGHTALAQSSSKIEWALMAVLYAAAAVRFSVNMALLYLYVRWAEKCVLTEHQDWSQEQVATAAAPLVGNFNAATLIGMALGGVLAGVFIRPGKEKWPMVLVPIGFAPIIGLFPYAPLEISYLLAVAAGIGFASMIPVSIAFAQHLMPRHTNLASGLMMGGAWSVAVVGPRCAEIGVSQLGLPTTFVLTAIALALSGIISIRL
jgi:FSR family fosmidomycin resistance protein-like MFS transporter